MKSHASELLWQWNYLPGQRPSGAQLLSPRETYFMSCADQLVGGANLESREGRSMTCLMREKFQGKSLASR